jgi:hypothetical protein
MIREMRLGMKVFKIEELRFGLWPLVFGPWSLALEEQSTAMRRQRKA